MFLIRGAYVLIAVRSGKIAHRFIAPGEPKESSITQQIQKQQLRDNMKPVVIACALALVFTTVVHAAGRLPTIPPEKYTDEQKSAADDFMASRKVPVFGPFEPLMHSPQVMSQARAMGDYLRYNSAIGNTLSEFVILITAREWAQDYEWYVHYPIALKAGIKPEIASAIADGRRPAGMSDDEEIVYDFSTELHKNKRVSDSTFNRAEKRFGSKGVVDLTGINAYYTLLAMQLNVAQYQLPANGKKLARFPE
ncbi:carboxymuconolactone decarboxylase family protein [Glaciimonas sp. GG7]